MRRQLATGLIAFGFLGGLVLPAPARSAAEVPELETFVVSGEQPGPGLWKVSKGDHVMWVLAAYAPLPKDMTWGTQQIEARITESQEVLYAANISIAPNIGLFRALTLIPAALKAGKIPDGRTLKDVLPPETYARWLELRQKYMGKDDDAEKYRPAIALEQLRGAAMRKSKLFGGPNVYAVVGDIRKKHKIASNMPAAVSRTVRVEDPRGMLKAAQKLQLPDVECFTSGLEQIEPEIERVRELGNAWARGDITKLRSMHRNLTFKEELNQSCANALMIALREGKSTDAAHLNKTMADFEWHAELASVQSQLNWIAAAKVALEKNPSTFAVLSVSDVLRPDGHIEKLRALGYTVEEPQ